MSKIKLTESQLHKLIKESVQKILTESDWSMFMNAARERRKQAQDIDDMYHKHGLMPQGNSYHDRAKELETYAQKKFGDKHGKNGHGYQYEGPSADFQGNRSDDEEKFAIKNPTDKNGQRHYRIGRGVPYMNGARLEDTTLDVDDDGLKRFRRHQVNIDKDGEHYDSNMSTVGNEVSLSKSHPYNKAWRGMEDDLLNYYSK